ncbi:MULTISPECIES: DUF4123 domain-containing protein [unclassified Pseudomonas]|uniref:DUF4123 domain-containing protein n=1 Tax=unclassified Pseudomonas TaxID=196821 RepID=UPI000A1D8A20|nr:MULTISPECIES: DUF4123 domain-containing protein [unclassified Pseudomonas]
MRRSAKSASGARRESVRPDQWLAAEPLKPSEQLFAVLSGASAGEPLKAWPSQAPTPVWAETAFSEWEAVMPYVGVVAADSEFLEWAASTESEDWGWLGVSSASLEEVAAHLCSLTQVLLSDGRPAFFRFWDGRFLLPILASPEVDAETLLAVFGRALVNGRAVTVGGRGQASGCAFPWWRVPQGLLASFGGDVRMRNALQWLNEAHPALAQAFPADVLRHKVARFYRVSVSQEASETALLDYLLEETQ